MIHEPVTGLYILHLLKTICWVRWFPSDTHMHALFQGHQTKPLREGTLCLSYIWGGGGIEHNTVMCTL